MIGETKLTFDEFSTVLTQVEACLNSQPLAPLPCDGDTIEPLTPSHFLIGRPLEALPDPSASYQATSLLRRWHLCQHMIRHFWRRWTAEYIAIIRRFVKWHHPSRNLQIGDVVILQEDNLVPTKWPLGRTYCQHLSWKGWNRESHRHQDNSWCLQTSNYQNCIATSYRELNLPHSSLLQTYYCIMHVYLPLIEDHLVLAGGMFDRCCITS